MMIKFYADNASAAYLEKATDHKGRPRAGVDVLRGDPELVGQVADSLEFKHRTTSLTWAWKYRTGGRQGRHYPFPRTVVPTVIAVELLCP